MSDEGSRLVQRAHSFLHDDPEGSGSSLIFVLQWDSSSVTSFSHPSLEEQCFIHESAASYSAGHRQFGAATAWGLATVCPSTVTTVNRRPRDWQGFFSFLSAVLCCFFSRCTLVPLLLYTRSLRSLPTVDAGTQSLRTRVHLHRELP